MTIRNPHYIPYNTFSFLQNVQVMMLLENLRFFLLVIFGHHTIPLDGLVPTNLTHDLVFLISGKVGVSGWKFLCIRHFCN